MSRSKRSAAVGAVAALLMAMVATTADGAAAASSYSAPLPTAVRALPVAAEVNDGYDRDRYFGHWVYGADCQDTRSEVLIQESRVPATGGCVINNGRWLSYFDNRTYTDASSVQIDHLVPVAEAWGSGARSWSQARRVAFYNDLGDRRSLNVMTTRLNDDKSASGPESWLPPYQPARCRYVAEWTAIKLRWSLSVDTVERAALIRYADSCPSTTVNVRRV